LTGSTEIAYQLMRNYLTLVMYNDVELSR
jgi:hypothetical protein